MGATRTPEQSKAYYAEWLSKAVPRAEARLGTPLDEKVHELLGRYRTVTEIARVKKISPGLLVKACKVLNISRRPRLCTKGHLDRLVHRPHLNKNYRVCLGCHEGAPADVDFVTGLRIQGVPSQPVAFRAVTFRARSLAGFGCVRCKTGEMYYDEDPDVPTVRCLTCGFVQYPEVAPA